MRMRCLSAASRFAILLQLMPAACLFADADGFAGRPQYVAYRSFAPQLERTRNFADIGIPLRCFFVSHTIKSNGTPYCDYPPVWTGFGNYDWSAFEAQADDLLKASPKAEFLCMIDLNTPYWATRRFCLDSFLEVSHAACDAKWIEETTRWMLDFIAYAEKRYGSRIRAYILSGGGTSEWYEFDRERTSRNKNRTWVNWCARNSVDGGAAVPDLTSLRRAAFENFVYDPATENCKIHYWRFHNEVIADAILSFAASARKNLPPEKEIGVFYGYYYVTNPHFTSFGHLDYERVFASPDIDFFIAPSTYAERGMGGGSGSQLVHSTLRRHGKRLLHEIDFGPHSQTNWARGVWRTFEDDLAGNTREAAFAIVNGSSCWWFDMWGGEAGFYDDQRLRERIGKLARITRRHGGSITKMSDEVLLVADPESLYHLNEKDPKGRIAGEHIRNMLAKTGVPFDVCTFSDLGLRDMSTTRVVVMPATIVITPAKRRILDEVVFADGRTVVFCYAPGLSDGQSLDVGRVREYAGVPYGTAGVSTTERNGWRSVYAHDCSLYTPKMLRSIIRQAGVKVGLSALGTVFANDRLVAVHTKDGGRMRVALHRKARRIVNLLTGETVAENTDAFDWTFSAPDTQLFSIGHD